MTPKGGAGSASSPTPLRILALPTLAPRPRRRGVLRTVSPFEAVEKLFGDPRHVLVVGITGAGKTTFVSRVLIPAALRENYTVVIVDMDGEYVAYEPEPIIPLPFRSLPSTIARMVAASSETTGSATFLALSTALNGDVVAAKQAIMQLQPARNLRELIANLKILVRVYGYGAGAAAALSRLLPLADSAELGEELLEGLLYTRKVIRFDLSKLPEYVRETAAACIVSSLAEIMCKVERDLVEKVVVIAEEAQRYWRQAGGSLIEQGGRKHHWKIIRVEQSVPEDAHNYNVVIGNMGIDRERFFLDTRFPARIKELGDMEFLVYVVGENKWYKTELAPLLRLEEPRLARVKRGIKQVKQKIKVRKRGR